MGYDRPIVLSIAGFDPCGGAGVLADIKTFEQHHCLGMAVNSALTVQVEDHFGSVDWFSPTEIKKTLVPLLERYPIFYVKIGIVASLKELNELISFLKKYRPEIKLIWDPVLSASTGFQLIEELDKELLKQVLKQLDLICPNISEAKRLATTDDGLKAAKLLAEYCPVLLKGGHRETVRGTDVLFIGDQEIVIPALDQKELNPKHGSGCILSASIIANLALGHDLPDACRKAKVYIENSLKSNANLLAYHAS